jgi:hypothetical protein
MARRGWASRESSGSRPPAAQIACGVTGCGDTPGSRVTPTVTAGVTYYIIVDGTLGQSGRYKLRVTSP